VVTAHTDDRTCSTIPETPGHNVRQLDKTTWACTVCSAAVVVPRDQRPSVVLVTESGKPRERVVMVDGQVVHRCRLHADGAADC